eukprot:GHVN01063374.1.p1 GENE.GHVN01063374.1~~GHVN01063374.1.p1  ORF type:complete len:135 (+),score=28.68 GHVN01063374.1:781-1185(+)
MGEDGNPWAALLGSSLSSFERWGPTPSSLSSVSPSLISSESSVAVLALGKSAVTTSIGDTSLPSSSHLRLSAWLHLLSCSHPLLDLTCEDGTAILTILICEDVGVGVGPSLGKVRDMGKENKGGGSMSARDRAA